MISRLNEQVLGSSDNELHTERTKEAVQRRSNANNDQMPALSEKESPATSTLRNLVEENAKSSPVEVASEGKNHSGASMNADLDDESSAEDTSMRAQSPRKRSAAPNSSMSVKNRETKRTRPSVL
jgi:hypothetical protein